MRAALGSIAVHAGALALGAWIAAGASRPAPAPARGVPIEIVDARPERDPAAISTAAAPSTTPSGGGGGSPSRLAHRAATRRARASAGELAVAGEVSVRMEAGGDGASGVTTGRGGGRGAGIGFGAGGGIGAQPPPPPPPPPPAEVSRSLARPARLVYPARERDVDAERLFVAKITVDADGFVVGARFVHVLGTPRDRVAADAVWRFRYDPARDDLGRPIRSEVEQPFGVE